MTVKWITAILATTVVAGCDQASREPVGDENSVGLPNPAATFCIEQGGEYDLESGMCRLKDGIEVDAWTYFREHAEPGSE